MGEGEGEDREGEEEGEGHVLQALWKKQFLSVLQLYILCRKVSMVCPGPQNLKNQ